jgi:hypothetical protein
LLLFDHSVYKFFTESIEQLDGCGIASDYALQHETGGFTLKIMEGSVELRRADQAKLVFAQGPGRSIEAKSKNPQPRYSGAPNHSLTGHPLME